MGDGCDFRGIEKGDAKEAEHIADIVEVKKEDAAFEGAGI